MARQYVAVKFHLTDRSTYTYHNDGEPVNVGDEVKVPDHRTNDWKRVTVVGVRGIQRGHYETKAILGLAPPREDVQ